ncbi:LysR family transcriptional regulator [Vibrio apostichopi]|uniref:LysR family transcriptional regulator n=1 Tax=Vibrio apostichopi TaxID=3035453 RepID=UPI00257346A5|nr:LysR family transcriptional regulator [Vibrio sp. FE10]
MDVSYRQLKAFITLVETKSFTAAAEQIHITQSALSQMMQKLAVQTASELIEKRGRKILLTETGRTFYQEALFIVNRLDKWELENKARQQGYHRTLVISSLYSMCSSLVPKTISELKRTHPSFSFRLIEERVNDIHNSVLEGRADIGIGTPPNNSELNFELLFRDHLCFTCNKAHHLSAESEVNWKQAHQYASIGISPGNSLRTLADQAFIRAGLTYDPEISASHTSTLLGMIDSGLGSAILSSTIASLHAHENLRFIPIVKPIQYRSIGLITRKETHRQIIDEFNLMLRKQVSLKL